MQNDMFSDEDRGGIDSFALFQSFFHSEMEIKLLKTLCNFYSYLGADKRHFILRSENKMFQFLTRSKEQNHLWLLPKTCLFMTQS